MKNVYNKILNYTKLNKKTAILIGILIIVFGILALLKILPEKSTVVNQDIPEGMEGAVEVCSGDY